MPTITGSTLVAKAQLIAQDTGFIRWTAAEWLTFLNDAQKAVVVMKPTAGVKVAVMALVVGTRQTLPADGVDFLEIWRNMGSGGTTPGLTPRRVSRAAMNAQLPTWQSAAPAAVVTSYMHDPEARRTFFVFPPADGTSQVEVEYVALPADLTSVGSVIGLEDVYALPMIDYMLYRAYLKDIEFVGNAERALFHLKQCEQQLGVKAA